MISISRPACGTFQENKYKEKLALNLKFIAFLLFSKIIITIFQNILIFAKKFDIIKPTGENNDFNV